MSLQTDRYVYRLLGALLILLLAGCGFHLKGYTQPSQALNGLHIAGGDEPESLAGVLQGDLLAGGVILMPDRESAKYTVQITREKFSSRVLSVDANGKALDNEIRLQAEVRLIPAKPVEAPQSQRLELVRQLSFSGSDELGQRNETTLMMEDMRRDMSAQISRRLEARLK